MDQVTLVYLILALFALASAIFLLPTLVHGPLRPKHSGTKSR